MPRGNRVDEAPKGEEQKKPKPASKGASPRTKAVKAPMRPSKKAVSQPVAPLRLLEIYRKEAVPQLTKEFRYKNPMEIPRVEKIVLNIGLGETLTNPKAQESALKDLTMISGQSPVVTKARKSIAGFKLRAGMAIGMKVTLRGRRMYEFLDKFMNVTLPRIRDFRGVSRGSGDSRGNYSIGLREQSIFPEIDYNRIDRLRGLQITIVTTAKHDQECVRLLELLGMPFTRVQEAIAASA